MVVAARQTKMPRASKPKRDDVAVKVDREVIRAASTNASYLGLNLNEYVSDRLASAIVQDTEERLAKETAKAAKGRKTP